MRPVRAWSRSSMSTERTTLRGWIQALVDALDDDTWGAGDRLREVVGGYSARIALDDETVLVSMPEGRLEWQSPDAPIAVEGEGGTTSGVVLAILDGRLEVTDAVERGLVQAAGSPDAVVRMFHAIELILDASARVPALRRLEHEFRRQAAVSSSHRIPAPPRPPGPRELALLGRLGVARER
jgi:hypothetical protein